MSKELIDISLHNCYIHILVITPPPIFKLCEVTRFGEATSTIFIEKIKYIIISLKT